MSRGLTSTWLSWDIACLKGNRGRGSWVVAVAGTWYRHWMSSWDLKVQNRPALLSFTGCQGTVSFCNRIFRRWCRTVAIQLLLRMAGWMNYVFPMHWSASCSGSSKQNPCLQCHEATIRPSIQSKALKNSRAANYSFSWMALLIYINRLFHDIWQNPNPNKSK